MNAALPEVGTLSPARLGEITGNGRFRRNLLVNFLNRQLMDLFAGEFPNLGVAGPPRHGKTRILNTLAAAHFLGTNPTKQVIAASHSAKLASKFGQSVRDLLFAYGPDTYGVRVREDRFATDNWELAEGGGMLSIGVGGSLVGFGADLFILDDIIADSAAALSEIVRNSTMDWYESTAETRLNAGAIQIFTMQRWHDDDPYQRIVKANPQDWRSFDIRAISEEDDVLGRSPDEALWPQRYPLHKLLRLQERKPFWFAAQYQQRPVPRGGGMFQAKWFTDNVVHYFPDADARIRWWDRAASDGKGDYTAGVRMSRKNGIYYIEHVERGQWATTERDRVIRARTKEDNDRWPSGVTTWGEQEPGSAGKDSALAFESMLGGYAAHCETSTGSKVIRADAFAGACGRGEVRMVAGDWNDAFVQELSTFPYGKNDDQVDAVSGCYNKLALHEGDRESAYYNPDTDMVLAEYGEGVTF